MVLKRFCLLLSCSYISGRWCQTAGPGRHSVSEASAHQADSCFPLSVVPTITVPSSQCTIQVWNGTCEHKLWQRLYLVRGGTGSTEGVSGLCHGLEGPGGLVTDLRGFCLCYSQILPVAHCTPTFPFAGQSRGWPRLVLEVEFPCGRQKVELHLLARLGKALNFPVRFSRKLIMEVPANSPNCGEDPWSDKAFWNTCKQKVQWL